MPDNSYHRQLHRVLTHYSAQLEELLAQAQQTDQPLSAELLDEIAGTVGELMLTLRDLQPAHLPASAIRLAIADSQRLRVAARSQQLRREQLAAAVTSLLAEVDHVIREDKRAA